VYLPNINASPLNPLDTILGNINSTVGGINTSITNINNNVNGLYPLHGSGIPTANSTHIGQLYIDVTSSQLFYSVSTGTSTVWQSVCLCSPISARIFDNTFDLTFN
jgi:hypothetical protein